MEAVTIAYISAGATVVLALLTLGYLIETHRIAVANKRAAEAALSTANQTADVAELTRQAVRIETCPALASMVGLSPERTGKTPGPWSIAAASVTIRNLGRTAAMNIQVEVSIGGEDGFSLFRDTTEDPLATSISPENEVKLLRGEVSTCGKWQAGERIPVHWEVTARNLEGKKYISTFEAECFFGQMLSHEGEVEQVLTAKQQGELLSCEPVK